MDNRPSPLPTLEQRLQWQKRPHDQRHVMVQKWRHLLFLHWAVDPAVVQATLPAGLTVDTFEGQAFIGIVPFFMIGVRPRFLPAVPGISHFMEANVRTYVYDQNGVPGVWFYSLDANQRLAVRLARRFFKLPYFYGQLDSPHINFWGLVNHPPVKIAYTVQREGVDRGERSHFRYRSAGGGRTAAPGSLEFFLVERYILFATPNEGTLATGQVHHQPYPIHEAYVAAWDANLMGLAGFEKPTRPPDHVLYSPGVDVDVFPLKRG
mgnify:CR=1 FL=1